MKRLLAMVTALLLTIPVAMGGMVLLSYRSTGEDTVPQPEMLVMDTPLTSVAYRWHEPVFGGLLYRDFRSDAAGAPQRVGVLSDALLRVSVPDGYRCDAEILAEGEQVWAGGADELKEFRFLNSGEYQLRLECERAKESFSGYGIFQYLCNFTVVAQPRVEASDEWVTQGDVVALRVFNLNSDMWPTAGGDLGGVAFVQDGPGMATGYLPVSREQPAGAYTTEVSAGRFFWEVPVRVTETNYDSLQMEEVESWDAWRLTSDDLLANWASSSVIQPLLEETEPLRYWEGTFTPPVQGEASCGYGVYRYLRNSSTALAHNGIDYTGRIGTEVAAPAAGRVLFAGYISSCGNTVVIEHGVGLKSILLYLDSVAVEEGDRVEAGQKIGELGQSGNAVVPHVHYEMRLGLYTIDPVPLFDGTSALYHFDIPATEEENGDEPSD